MKVKRSPSGHGPRTQVRGAALQRRNLTNIGLLMGVAAIGTLAAGLWVRMVLF